MSALMAPLVISEVDRTASPELHALPQRRARMATLPFVLVLLGVLASGMVGLLVLNTTIQDQSRVLRSLQREASALGDQQAALQSEVDQLRSSGYLAQRATELGMRANPYPAFIEVPSGTVIGPAQPVTGNELPGMVWTEQVTTEPLTPKVPSSQVSTAAAGSQATPEAGEVSPVEALPTASPAIDPVAAPVDAGQVDAGQVDAGQGESDQGESGQVAPGQGESGR